MKRKGLIIAALGLIILAQVAQADWTTYKRLTWTSGESNNPAIAVDSAGDLHVVWDDPTPGNWEIYYKKSTDAGTTWTISKRLTLTSGASSRPAIAVDPYDNLHLVWSDETPGNGEILYKKSTDGGATWTKDNRLTWTSGHSFEPVIAVDPSGNLHVVWEDYTPGNGEIFYVNSSDGGTTWTTSKRLTWNSGLSYEPAMAVDPSGNLHVSWVDGTSGNWEIYYKKSTDGGITWETSKRISWTSGGSYAAALAVDPSGNLHMFWSDDTPGNYEVYRVKSTDGGATWTKSQRLTWTSGESWWPAIAVDSPANLHVVWYDDTLGNYEIYYKKSTDGGATWTANNRLTWNSGASEVPAIGVDSSGNLHVVWEDSTPGNIEIYYKKFIK